MGTMAGISMHTELELLVRMGLSPREALAAATNNYALQFGWNELGLIAPGRRADILVLDADPTQNIWNARRISNIVMDGNVLDRDRLLNWKKRSSGTASAAPPAAARSRGSSLSFSAVREPAGIPSAHPGCHKSRNSERGRSRGTLSKTFPHRLT